MPRAKKEPAEGAEPPAKRPRAKKAAVPPAPAPPAERTRVVVPSDLYEERKDALKGVLKGHDLKWQYLGPGKGRYHKEGVHVFLQFAQSGAADYTVWGEDEATVRDVLGKWRALLGDDAWAKATAGGEQAAAEEKREEESDAMRLWRLQEPQPRAGEPEFFLRKRREEWLARRPGA